MALSIVQSAKYASSSADNQAVLSISTPSNGNLLLAAIAIYPSGGSRSITPPSGWTLLTTLSYSSVLLSIYYKVASSEGTNPSYTFTISGSTDYQGAGIYEITGQDPTAPFNEYNMTSNTSSTTCTTPAVTPTVNGCLAIFAATEDTGGSNTDTISSGCTLDQSARPQYHACDIGHKNALTTDTITAMQATFTWLNSISIGATILINPVLPVDSARTLNNYRFVKVGNGMGTSAERRT